MARWAAGLRTATGGAAPADVLAGVAAAVGAPWDGPGRPVPVEVPEAPGWLVLDAARQALVVGGDRRRLGAHHTPPDLCRRLVAIAVDGMGADVTVADPACGGGAFLVAAADHLVAAGADPARVVAEQLVGLDLDPLAVATTRAALASWATDRGVTVDAVGVRCGDGLVDRWEAEVVVGNPPFLSPLAAATAGTAAAAELRRRLGAPYADVAGLFLLRALDQVRLGGRVMLLQPESLLSSRDARPVREAATPLLEGLWVAGEPVFGATVRVCAPLLHAASGSTGVRRWTGRAVRDAGRARRPGPESWASLRPTSAPPIRVPTGAGRLGDLATATAGFRGQFYGIAAALTDGGPGRPVVTSGLLDPGRPRWGERPARIAGRRWNRPTVDPGHLDPALRGWVEALLVPKVVVATQTRVVEAAADPAGELVPLTPVVAVVPGDPADVWRIAAALSSPLVTAWALRHAGGAALSADAIKLSARQVLDAPLPADEAAWAEATEALAAGDVAACAATLAAGDRRLFDWWQDRAPRAAS